MAASKVCWRLFQRSGGPAKSFTATRCVVKTAARRVDPTFWGSKISGARAAVVRIPRQEGRHADFICGEATEGWLYAGNVSIRPATQSASVLCALPYLDGRFLVVRTRPCPLLLLLLSRCDCLCRMARRSIPDCLINHGQGLKNLLHAAEQDRAGQLAALRACGGAASPVSALLTRAFACNMRCWDG